MPNWFYFDKNEKKGPFTSEELFSLAASGEIRWGTIVETENGTQTLAKNVKGLFPTQESATKAFVAAPPIATPGAAPVTAPVTAPGAAPPMPPVKQSESFSAVSHEKNSLNGQISSFHSNKTRFFSIKRFFSIWENLCQLCVISCVLLCIVGTVFSMTAYEERKIAEEKIEDNELNNAYSYIINGTYFTAYSVRSLQYTIQSSVCFILGGMFGMTALFLKLKLNPSATSPST